MGRLSQKVALITGGASGLGRAMGLLFTDEGAKVVLTDINETQGQAVVTEIKNKGGDARFISHDVTSEEQWESVINQTLETFGQLDIVVNSAGVATLGNVEETSYEDWRKVNSINLDGVFLGTKHGVRAIKNNPAGGSIINLSSIMGLVGDANLAGYNASKGGVKLLSKSAALHCAQAGYKIRVNSIHPGYIRTPMVEGAIKGGHADEEHLKSLHPVGHLGEPNDIAYGALYLASDESKFVTGSELVIDGGYTAW